MKGYDYGKADLERSPVTEQELLLLKKTVLWSDEDERYLQLAATVLNNQKDQILDLWYGFVGSHPHLVHYFTSNGAPDAAYLTAVRARFGQWITDLCTKPYNQQWLDYQHEIAKRHHRVKKNKDRWRDTGCPHHSL